MIVNMKRCAIALLLACVHLNGQQYVISTVAGHGIAGAFLNNPTSIAVNSAGDLYVADWSGFLRKVWMKDRATTTFAGSGIPGYGGDGGPATNAKISKVIGMAVTVDGTLYFADSENNRIRVVDPATGLIATAAGTGGDMDNGDGGPAVDAGVSSPKGMVIDSEGNLYFSISWSRIRRIVAATGIIETIAGRAGNGLSGDDGPALEAHFWGPVPSAIDRRGNLYLADFENCRVRAVALKTATVNAVAGSGACPAGPFGIPVCRGAFGGDGGAPVSASLNYPSGVALDSAGNLYIADTMNHRIRRIDAATRKISTIAGRGSKGFSGDGGPALAAELSSPSAVTVDGSGRVYFSDLGNNRVRLLMPVGP